MNNTEPTKIKGAPGARERKQSVSYKTPVILLILSSRPKILLVKKGRKFYIKGNLLLTLGICLSNQEQCEDTKGQSESVNRKGTDNTRSKSQMPFQTKKKREKKRIIYLLMTDS